MERSIAESAIRDADNQDSEEYRRAKADAEFFCALYKAVASGLPENSKLVAKAKLDARKAQLKWAYLVLEREHDPARETARIVNFLMNEIAKLERGLGLKL